jgi:hypothetical protein
MNLILVISLFISVVIQMIFHLIFTIIWMKQFIMILIQLWEI